MNEIQAPEFRGAGKVVRVSLAATIVGVVTLVVWAFVDPTQLFFAYLAAYNYVVTIALGALVFLMTCHAMHAAWPTLLRRLTEAIVATFPFLLLLFFPLLFGLRELYPWLRPETVADEHVRAIMALRAPYLNVGWFLGRAAFYLVIWIFVGYWLRRWSLAQDRGAGPVAGDRMYAMSGVLLPLVALTLSFAAFDWIMTLLPHWQSTMFPVRYFAGGFIGALALLTVLTSAADKAGLIPGINDSHYYALGRLLLAFVIFWAYTEFFQFLLMWIANKPDEVTFYLARAHGGWLVESVILVIAQFALPFLVLLSYDLKRRRAPLTVVAVWLIAAHYVDVHWTVLPAARPTGSPVSLVDLGALLAVGGATVMYGVYKLRGVRMVPVNDPFLPDALRYESL
jgi:hypothetical protein